MEHLIPFNKPFITGKEFDYLSDVLNSGKLSGNGRYTQLCQQFFVNKYNFNKCLLTTSCTDALEMAAILINVQAGDEIILPSYTFVSTANAFALRGAKLVFADSRVDRPGLDEMSIEKLITPKTKAIIPVHYAGVSCDMDIIMDLANKYSLYVIEDAAQAIDSYFINKYGEKKPLGSIGHLAAFSFHETKNINSGEGGMLVINDNQFAKRAEIIWEKGTNRSSYFRGEVDKYGWVDIGSSFLPSELISAFLYAQLQNIDKIQEIRLKLWNEYYFNLKDWAKDNSILLPKIDSNTTNNAHMFYLVFKSINERTKFIKYCKENNIMVVFHYLSLHKSEYYYKESENSDLSNSDYFTDCLVRLPLFPDLTTNEFDYIISTLKQFYV